MNARLVTTAVRRSQSGRSYWAGRKHGVRACSSGSVLSTLKGTEVSNPRISDVRGSHVPFQGVVKCESVSTKIFSYYGDSANKMVFSTDRAAYVEVKNGDIGLKENLPMIVSEGGPVQLTRIWVRKGSQVNKVSPVII